jgi:hypothetical protein
MAMGQRGGIGTALALAASMAAPALASEKPNLRLRGSMRGRVARAVEGAAARLQRAECAGVLAEFRDASGRTLRDNLAVVGVAPPEYLDRILFYDGYQIGRCGAKGILAATQPGSSVVLICSKFFEPAGHDPRLAEAIIIHEALHTLGLGENPPSSREITARVLERCH